MTAYYSEIDTQKAAWLRELIKAGVIALGDVDPSQRQAKVSGLERRQERCVALCSWRTPNYPKLTLFDLAA